MNARISLVLGLCAALFPGVSMAQQITVRSGEHAEFSRLVVDMPRRVTWTMSGKGTQRDIRFAENLGSLNLSQVFVRMKRDRISGVAPLADGPGLSLEICDCVVEVAWYGASMLVIDVGGPLPSSTSIVSKLSKENRSSKRMSNESGIGDALTKAASAAPANSSAQLASMKIAEIADSDAARETVLDTAGLAEARRAIARDISKAATIGLLTTDAQFERASQEPAVRTATGKPTNEATFTALEGTPLPNFQTSNSAQTMLGDTEAVPAQTIAGRRCVSEYLMDIENWGTDGPFWSQLALARSDLTGEFDQYSPDAALRLARLYLFFGFGREASQIVQAVGLTGIEADVAIALARIIEQRRDLRGIFEQQVECSSSASLWSAVSADQAQLQKNPNVDAMLRALSAYPAHLKSLLGPRLAQSLAAMNRPNDATRVLRLLGRQLDLETDAAKMAQAQIELHLNNGEKAEDLLEAVVQGNSEVAAEALLQLVWNRLDAKEPLAPDIVDLIESFAREKRGTQIEGDLKGANLAALASIGLYDAAVAGLFDGQGLKLSEPIMLKTTEAVGFHLINDASDVTFLKHFLKDDVGNWKGLPMSLRAQAAERLFALGFDDAAQLYRLSAQASVSVEQRKLSKASADLANSLTQAAPRALNGPEGTEADRRRGRAFPMVGNQKTAGLADTSAGDTEDLMRKEISANASSDERSVSDAAIANAGASPDAGDVQGVGKPLEEGAALLAGSEKARAEIVELLKPGSVN